MHHFIKISKTTPIIRENTCQPLQQYPSVMFLIGFKMAICLCAFPHLATVILCHCVNVVMTFKILSQHLPLNSKTRLILLSFRFCHSQSNTQNYIFYFLKETCPANIFVSQRKKIFGLCKCIIFFMVRRVRGFPRP